MECNVNRGHRERSGSARQSVPDQAHTGGSVLCGLSKFLSSRLEDYGRQLEFARALSVSPGTVTKWLSGENTPNFESCLLISAYFEVDPATLFKMSGRFDHYRLYLKHFRTNVFYGQLHSRLQELINEGHSDEVDHMLAEIEKAGSGIGEDLSKH